MADTERQTELETPPSHETVRDQRARVGNFTDAIKQLNRETDLEAQKWFREKRKVVFPLVLWRMVHGFVKTYLFQGGCRDGFFGFMRAVNGSLYQLMSYTKYWELRERERGRM